MRPLYLPSADSRLFAVLHAPPAGDTRRGRVLLAPPIGEELNRCRLALSTAARRWSMRGWLTLMVDLYGTGDSPGDFGDATVARWQDDLRLAWQWLLEQECTGSENVLWTVRGGALVGLSLLAELSAQRVVLWAPQFSGREVVDSVLRLAATAEALAEQTGEASVRDRIRQSGVIEVGGYRWSEALLSGIERLGPADGAATAAGRDALWLEPSGRSERGAPAPLPAWRPRHAEGAAFWRTAEPVAAEAWATATEGWLQREAA